MTKQQNNVNANDSKVSAGGNVEFLGGNQYKIGGNFFNVDIKAPTHDSNLKHLEKSLISNRECLDEDFNLLEKLIVELHDLESDHVQAAIKDILITSRNIELLIPPIKLNGGKTRSLPNEANIVKRINNSIGSAIKKVKQELSELEYHLKNYKSKLNKVVKFKFGRSNEDKQNQINYLVANIKSTESRLKNIKTFLNK